MLKKSTPLTHCFRKNRLSSLLRQRGSAIIEVVIAAGVVGVIATSVAVALTSSLHAAAQSRYRQTATDFGQDLIESVRKERKFLGWPTFYERLEAVGSSITYCVPDQGLISIEETGNLFGSDSDAGSCDEANANHAASIDNINFYRTVVLTLDDAEDRQYIQMQVTVEWRTGAKQQSVVLNHRLSEWTL